MRVALATLGTVVVAGCARPAAPSPALEPSPRAAAAVAEPAVAPTVREGIDPSSLPVWANTSHPQVEVWAADADRILLAAALLEPGELVELGNVSYATGRLASTSRRAAADAIDIVRRSRPARGSSPIDIALYHQPRARLSEILGGALGVELVWLEPAASRETLFASKVSAQAVLADILASRDLATVRDGGAVLIVDRQDVKVIEGVLGRSVLRREPRLDVAADDIRAFYVAALVATLAPRAVLSGCVWGKISLGLRDAPVARVLARLATRTAHSGQCAPLEQWNPEKGLRDSDRVVAIATRGAESAALIETADGVFLLRPGRFSHGKIAIQGDNVSITYSGTPWSSSLDFATLAARDWDPTGPADESLISTAEAVPRLDPKSWRLAATMRDGTSWRALVVSIGLDWAWLDSSDPRISIEPGRVKVARDDGDIVLHLRGVRDRP